MNTGKVKQFTINYYEYIYNTIQYNTRAIYTRKDKTRTVPFYTSMSYLIRRVLAMPRLILDEMYRLYGKFASYVRRVLFFLV